MGDRLDALVRALGRPWRAVEAGGGRCQLCRGDHFYMEGRGRDDLFRKFAEIRPAYGPAGEAWFKVPPELDSKSEEELALKLEVYHG